ncbi:DMT family transporter, partial [Nitrospirales bacterium NOB]|nr:DMT family transporter [Nitrospirales bacterium NOB]
MLTCVPSTEGSLGFRRPAPGLDRARQNAAAAAGTLRHKMPEGVGWRARACLKPEPGREVHPMFPISSHMRAVLQALFVTLLWSSSWVLIKQGLKDIPALTFAGLRYTLAFLCLLPLAARRGDLRTLRR